MKTTGITLILSILSFALSGCLTSSKTYQQITSMNIDCKTDDIQILDEVFLEEENPELALYGE